jgi:hypothetical protein
MKRYVSVLTAAYVLMLLGACKEEQGTPELGNACVPEPIPLGPAGSGFAPRDTQLSAAKECGGDPCILHRLDNGTDGGLPADPTRLCSQEQPIAGCVNASQLANSVYCTCRCDGPDRDCVCPDEYACLEVLTVGPNPVRGSFCVKRPGERL